MLLSATSGRLLSTPGTSNLPRGANKVLDLSTRLTADAINQSGESRGPLCDLYRSKGGVLSSRLESVWTESPVFALNSPQFHYEIHSPHM